MENSVARLKIAKFLIWPPPKKKLIIAVFDKSAVFQNNPKNYQIYGSCGNKKIC